MADKQKKNDSSKDDKIFYGKDVESLQDKVDSYMDSSIPDKKPAARTKEATGAPLLPTDKLPQSVTKSESKKNSDTDKKIPKTEELKSDTDDGWIRPAESKDNLKLDSPATSKAVDEIMAAESDKLLEAEDQEKVQKQPEDKEQKPKEGTKLSRLLKSKRFYKWLLGLLFIAAMVAMAIPTSRYFILNSLGVRASTSMRVIDAKTNQPLKNVGISIMEQSAETDENGVATLYDIKLGNQNLAIKKPAFAAINQEVTIGWGSNPLGDMELTPVGAQYRFVLNDFLSGQPIAKAEAFSGEANATSNEKGELVLVIEDTDEKAIDVTISADSYRQEKVKVSPGEQQVRKLAMVPSRKHAFVSKRSGTYDLYKTYIDGKGEKMILKGSGRETEEDLVLVNHPTEEMAAFVSIRGDARSNSGELLSTLQVVNLNSNEVNDVVSSSRLQVIDWVGDRLIYVKEDQDKKVDDPGRHKLMSYDYVTGGETVLANAIYFNDVSVAKGVVYYSPASDGKDKGFYTVNTDGSANRAITDKEVWNIFRTSYNSLRVSMGQQWYDYNLSSGEFSKADGPPTVLKSRIYYDSPDRTRSLWSEDRDGKGTLIVFDQSAGEDEVVLSKSGLKNPLRWLDNEHVVFRIGNSDETADYAMSLSGGEAKKITDVTDVTGIDRWYFY